jgi:hypothetical protein
MTSNLSPSVLSLAQLLEQQPPTPPPCLVEPGLLPAQGILFVGGEPKVGKSLLVANLALSLAAGLDRLGFPISKPCRMLVCQFELPVPQFANRLATMRRAMGNAADHNLFIDTRAMASLCQSLLRLREMARAALIVVHHVRKSIGRYENGSAFRGSSALHAVGDSYLLVTRPAPQFNTVELRFQFRYAAPQPPRLLELDSAQLWFSASGEPSKPVVAADRRKVEPVDVTKALSALGEQARYNQLRQQIMTRTQCSKRTAHGDDAGDHHHRLRWSLRAPTSSPA